MSAAESKNSINELLSIMRALRDPEKGCPWDQVQTFETIAPYTIEEAYEVSDAITRKNKEDLCDELGDLLLQVVYHSQMAQEQHLFQFHDVVNAICKKMIGRHPHVFGTEEEIKSGKQDWERQKKLERAAKGRDDQDESALANTPRGLPPLLRARKLQKKAAQVNFDWPTYAEVFEKLEEEIKELQEAIRTDNNNQIEDEMGDVLFSVVNLTRHLKVDADVCLQKSNSKFEARFRNMEKMAKQKGCQIKNMNDNELNELWDQVKQECNY